MSKKYDCVLNALIVLKIDFCYINTKKILCWSSSKTYTICRKTNVVLFRSSKSISSMKPRIPVFCHWMIRRASILCSSLCQWISKFGDIRKTKKSLLRSTIIRRISLRKNSLPKIISWARLPKAFGKSKYLSHNQARISNKTRPISLTN